MADGMSLSLQVSIVKQLEKLIGVVDWDDIRIKAEV
jgi:hypothetical protein